MLKHIVFLVASPQPVELISFFKGAVVFLASDSKILKSSSTLFRVILFVSCGAAFEADFSEILSSASALKYKT